MINKILKKTWKLLTVKWSLWKYICLPVVFNSAFSIICYLIGWHLSTKDSTMPLARAGAAATSFAIACTLYDYQNRLKTNEQASLLKFKNLFNNLNLDKTGKEKLAEINEKLQKNTSDVVFIYSVIQAIILIIATVVWGFGDLIKYSF